MTRSGSSLRTFGWISSSICLLSFGACSLIKPHVASNSGYMDPEASIAADIDLASDEVAYMEVVQQPESVAVVSQPDPTPMTQAEKNAIDEADHAKMLAFCAQTLNELPGPKDASGIQKVCLNSKLMHGCESVEGRPIFHYDSESQRPEIAKRVLVMAVVHGDELESGSVARRWIERLMSIQSRNTWRIIPVLNPDGMKRYQRTNVRGVDINRNFPSEDWDDLALKWWKEKRNSNPRQYPGPSGGSEPETQCAMKHIDDFKPDFIVAIHTPYGVLDFDGPQVQVPQFSNLPWVSLGTFPGSLGRYMWRDNQVPVLTVELKDSAILKKIDDIDLLQDLAGTVAIRSTDQM